jgi:hypothetical protein
MACKCGSSRESLLTICIRTLVWSFARMYSSVPSQRAGIAETLFWSAHTLWI